jgi:hypothetical protein
MLTDEIKTVLSLKDRSRMAEGKAVSRVRVAVKEQGAF